MAYTINYTDSNKGSIVIEDSTIDQTTSLSIPGKNTTEYGTQIGQNFLRMLENFANGSAPSNPIEGQLWYDSTAGTDTLKVYDGTTWQEAGGIKRAASAPSVSASNTGDLWVDTDNQQLYLFTGSGWVLVGPEFSEGLSAGIKPEVVTGNDDVNYTILKMESGGNLIGIISANQFSPKQKFAGFDNPLRVGINLSTASLNGQGVPKFYGTADSADNLMVGNTKVSSASFVRSDQESTSSSKLNIANNSGITVGNDSKLSIGIEATAGVISQQTAGSPIDIKTNDAGNIATRVRIDSTGQVGIGNISPAAKVDIAGTLKTSGVYENTNITQSSNTGTGSIITAGGLGVAKSTYIGEALNVAGSVTTGDIVPQVNNNKNIGTSTNKYANIHATNIFGNVTGNVSGTITGRSGSTEKLASRTTFKVQGDVSAADVQFDGQFTDTGETTLQKVFQTTIDPAFISNKTAVDVSQFDDEFLVTRVTDLDGNGTGVRKISRNNLFNALPVNPLGMVVPYAVPADNIPADLTAWQLCDGRELFISSYGQLFQLIGYTYKAQSETTAGKFALPDLRGRFPLGKDNMGGTSANRVTGTSADQEGLFAGGETKVIGVENLPDHEHDLKSEENYQFYAIRDGNPANSIGQGSSVIVFDAPTGTSAGQAYPKSGGVVTQTGSGQPQDVMNPYLTMNYLMYTGNPEGSGAV